MITGITSGLLQMLVEVILDSENPSQGACMEEVSERGGSAKAELSFRGKVTLAGSLVISLAHHPPQASGRLRYRLCSHVYFIG